MAPLLYALAVVVPPLALLCCRRWWQAGVAWLAVVALVPAIPHSWGLPGLLLVYVPVMLWPLWRRRVRLPWGLGPATDGSGAAAVVVAGLLACGGWIALGLAA
jgi:hypothetical protein